MRTFFIFIMIVTILGTGLFLNDFFSEYREFGQFADEMPFVVYTPKYIPKGLSLDKEGTKEFLLEDNFDVQQFALFYKSRDEKSFLSYYQFDREQYKDKVLVKNSIPNFKTYFEKDNDAYLVKRDKLDIYVGLPEEKVKTKEGDYVYLGIAFLLDEESLIHIIYVDDKKISEEEIVKAMLSLKVL